MNAATPPTPPPSTRPQFSIHLRNVAIALGLGLLLLLADQIAKNLIASHYAPNQEIARLPVISLIYVTNAGGICGYAQGAGTLLTVIGGITTALIAASILFFVPANLAHSAALGLLLAGASGNLIDRLRFGYVIDYITVNLFHSPSFNLADLWIVGGIALVGSLTLWEAHRDGRSADSPQLDLLSRRTVFVLILALAALVVAYLLCVRHPFG